MYQHVQQQQQQQQRHPGDVYIRRAVMTLATMATMMIT